MDWMKQLNASIDYIEQHLTENISHHELSKIMMCSFDNYQKVFAYITGITLARYIRERRLTLAGIELTDDNQRIIDIAMKYGYTSQDAFTRAFKHFHGFLPSKVKNNAQLNTTPRLSYQIKIIGEADMNFRIESLESFQVIGKRFRLDTSKAFSEVPKIWRSAKKDGTLDLLLNHLKEARPDGILGIASEGRWGDNNQMFYMIGVTQKDSEQSIEPGFELLQFPMATYAVCHVDKKSLVRKAYQDFYSIWLPNSEYSLDDLPVIESYKPDGSLDIWFAVKRG